MNHNNTKPYRKDYPQGGASHSPRPKKSPLDYSPARALTRILFYASVLADVNAPEKKRAEALSTLKYFTVDVLPAHFHRLGEEIATTNEGQQGHEENIVLDD